MPTIIIIINLTIQGCYNLPHSQMPKNWPKK